MNDLCLNFLVKTSTKTKLFKKIFKTFFGSYFLIVLYLDKFFPSLRLLVLKPCK